MIDPDGCVVSGAGFKAQRIFRREAEFPDVERAAADAVAAHLGFAPVAVENNHAVIGGRGGRNEDDAVSPDAAAPVAERNNPVGPEKR